ncbi:MAG TPA: NAD(P)-dependent oxidoreductase [Solirubrobacteraceae bacterium]|nr:NAD(P)-dependent oxidoreductase [Solirubrobacteraceae bacterium]
MARVLLTGARGFIGRHAVGELVEGGFEVHAVSAGQLDGLDERARWHRADLTDISAARALVTSVRPTHLLHLAWYVEHGSFWTSPENERWLTASLALFDAFDGERVVCAGTCAEYDWTTDARALDERHSPIGPQTPYGVAKDALRRAAEERLGPRAISFAHGRIFFLHGPDEHPDRLVPAAARALLAGEPARCTDGRQVRDFLHAADAARAFAALLASDVDGPVNIASGEGVSVAELVTWIGAALGRPELIDLGALPSRPGEPERLVAEVARLREEVGFTPRFGPREGVEETVSWWASREADRASRRAAP